MTASVTIGTDRRTSAAVREHARHAAAGFARLGVRRGDVVALCLRNDFGLLEATVAAGMLGAYTTPLNWHSTPAEAAYVLQDSAAKVLVAHRDLFDRLRGSVPAGVHVLTVEPSADLVADYAIAPGGPAGGQDWETWLEAFMPHEGPPAVAPGAMVYTSGTTGRPKGVRRNPPSAEQAGRLVRCS